MGPEGLSGCGKIAHIPNHEMISGICKEKRVVFQWSDIDAEHSSISISKQGHEKNKFGNFGNEAQAIRQSLIPHMAVDLLTKEHAKFPDNPYLFPFSRTKAMA